MNEIKTLEEMYNTLEKIDSLNYHEIKKSINIKRHYDHRLPNQHRFLFGLVAEKVSDTL